jgi:hypothetical protein
MKKLENIIAENLLRFGVKNLSESNKEIIKKINEQEEEEPGTVTKKKSIGFNTTGGERNRNWVRGKDRKDAMGGITYTVTKEKDVNLVSVNDMLTKMSRDLAESEQYKKLPIDVKNALADGFYNVLLQIINGEVVSELGRKAGRDLKKFFTKSQRWAFSEMEVPENISELKYKISLTNPDSPEAQKEASEAISNLINDTNLANSTAGTIASKQANYLRIDGSTGELDYIASQKESLTTVLVNIEKGIAQKKTKEATTEEYISPIELTTPVNTEVFAAGKFNVAGAAAMVENIKKQIFNTTFTIKYGKNGSQSRTQTGRDIIAGGGKFTITGLDVLASASNYWQQSSGVLDYSHENNGTETKSFDQVDATGDSGQNKILANKRSEQLLRTFIDELKIIPYIDTSMLNDSRINKEIRITNTGGAIDEKRVKSQYPNPGQYAQISVTIAGKIETLVTEPAKYSQSGTFKQFGIKLIYLGKKETERSLQAGLVVSGGDKSTILKSRPLKTAFTNLGAILSGDAAYYTDDDGKKVRIKTGGGLSTGSDRWHRRRDKQHQKKIGNR